MRPGESFVGQPIRSLQTMLRVIAENDGSIPTVIPDGIYSQETMNSVSAFQRRQGLPVTGVTDQATWDAIIPVYEDAYIQISKAQPIEIIMDPGQIYRSGDSSPWLYLMQSMLYYLSEIFEEIEKPNHSGSMDTATQQALKGFQVLAGLPPTGELDKKTWKYLVHQFTLSANTPMLFPYAQK